MSHRDLGRAHFEFGEEWSGSWMITAGVVEVGCVVRGIVLSLLAQLVERVTSIYGLDSCS